MKMHDETPERLPELPARIGADVRSLIHRLAAWGMDTAVDTDAWLTSWRKDYERRLVEFLAEGRRLCEATEEAKTRRLMATNSGQDGDREAS